MSKLDDLFANKSSKEPNVEWKLVDMSMLCSTCNMTADEVYYDPFNHKVKTVCGKVENIIDMELSWFRG